MIYFDELTQIVYKLNKLNNKIIEHSYGKT